MRNLCFPFKSKEVSWRTISPKKISLYYQICVEFLKGDLIIDEYWHIFHMKGKIAVEDQVLKQKGWRGTAIQVDYQGNMIPLESGYAFCLLPLPDKTGPPVQVNGYFGLLRRESTSM